MAFEPPEFEPSHLQAGEQWDWTRPGGDFPADEWTGTYVLVKSDARVTIADPNITADGQDYAVSILASTTANYGLGTWRWQFWVTNIADNTIVRCIDTGWLRVIAAFSAAAYSSGYDYRSHDAKMLALIKTAMELKATGDVASYQINGRQTTHYTWETLRNMRNYYQRKVNAEREENLRRRGLTAAGQKRFSIGGLK